MGTRTLTEAEIRVILKTTGMENLKQLQTAIEQTKQKLGSDLAAAGKQAGVSMGGFGQVMAGLASGLSGFGDKLITLGKNTQWLGRQFMYNVSLPLIGIGTIAIKSALDFSQSMAQVAAAAGTTTLETDKDFMIMKNAAETMGRTTMFSSKEAASGLYEFVSAGFSAAEAAKQLPIAIKFAEAAQLELGDATKFSSEMLHIWGAKGYDLQKIMDIVSVSVQESQAHFSDFTHNIEMSAQFAQVAGISFENLSSAMMVMADRGVPAARAGFNLRQAFSQMINPSNKAQEVLTSLGLTYWDLEGKMKPFPTILSEIRHATAEMTDEQKSQTLATLFNVRAGSAMLSLLQGTDEEYQRYVDIVNNASGATNEMANTMEQSSFGQFKIIMNQIKQSIIDFGEALLPTIIPMLKQFGESIKNITKWFDGLDKSQKEFIVKIGLILVALGPAIIAIGMLSEAIGMLFKVVGAPFALIKFFGLLSQVSSSAGVAKTATALFTGELGSLAKKSGIATGSTSTLVAGLGTVGGALTIAVLAIGALTIGYNQFRKAANDMIDIHNKVVQTMHKGTMRANEEKISWLEVAAAVSVTLMPLQALIPGIGDRFVSMGSKIQKSRKDVEDFRKMLSQEFKIPSIELKGLNKEELLKKFEEVYQIAQQQGQAAGQKYTEMIGQGMSAPEAINQLIGAGQLINATQKGSFLTTTFDASNLGKSFTQGLAMGMNAIEVLTTLRNNGIIITQSMIQPFINQQVEAGQIGSAFTMAISAGLTFPTAMASLQAAGVQITAELLLTLAQANPQVRAQAVQYIDSIVGGVQDPVARASLDAAKWQLVDSMNINDAMAALGDNAGQTYLDHINAKLNSVGWHLGPSGPVKSGRNPNGAAWDNDPFKHTGGWIKAHNGLNLLSNEIPTILQTGEFVMSRKGIRSVGNFLSTLNSGKNPLQGRGTASNNTYEIHYNLNPGVVIASPGELREFKRKLNDMEKQEQRRVSA